MLGLMLMGFWTVGNCFWAPVCYLGVWGWLRAYLLTWGTTWRPTCRTWPPTWPKGQEKYTCHLGNYSVFKTLELVLNKWTCLTSLSLVVLTAEENHHLTLETSVPAGRLKLWDWAEMLRLSPHMLRGGIQDGSSSGKRLVFNKELYVKCFMLWGSGCFHCNHSICFVLQNWPQRISK